MTFCICPTSEMQTLTRYGDEPDVVVNDYRLVLEDHFDQNPGEEPDWTKWSSSMPWGSGVVINNEEQHYSDVKNGDTSAPNPFIFDGQSNLILRAGINSAAQQIATGQKYYSGLISGFQHCVRRYGYFEARMKFPPAVIGFWGAFWLLNRNYEPNAGATGDNGKREPEIDIAELVRGPGGLFGGGPYDTDVAYLAYHYDGGQWKVDGNGFNGRDSSGSYNQPGLSQQCDGTQINAVTGLNPAQQPGGGDLAGKFHTYGCLWTEDSCRWYLDGVEVGSICDSLIMSQVDMYPIINNAVGGNFPGTAQESDYADSVDLVVDYIRIFEKI